MIQNSDAKWMYHGRCSEVLGELRSVVDSIVRVQGRGREAAGVVAVVGTLGDGHWCRVSMR
jgi:hypothetical protein